MKLRESQCSANWNFLVVSSFRREQVEVISMHEQQSFLGSVKLSEASGELGKGFL